MSATPAQHQLRHPARSVIGWVLTAGAASILLILARPVGLDLKVYREGAQALLQGADLYAPTLGPVGDPGLPFTYPPIAALLFAPLLVVPFPVAYWIMSAATVAATHLLVCDLAVRWSVLGSRATHAWVLTPFVLVTSPYLDTLTYGQINVLLMGVCYFGLTRAGRGWAFGVAVGLSAAIKLTPLALLLLPLLLWRWRAILGAGIVFISLQLATLVAFPKLTTAYWGSVIWDPSRVGNVDHIDNLSLRGVVERLGGPTWIWAVAAAVMVAVSAVAIYRRRHWDPVLLVGFAAAGMLLISPISWVHHFVWWPLMLAAWVGVARPGVPYGSLWSILLVVSLLVSPKFVLRWLGMPEGGLGQLIIGGLPALIILVATTAGAVSGGNERAPARSLADQACAR